MSDLNRAQDAMSKEHQRGKCGACGQSLVAEQRIEELTELLSELADECCDRPLSKPLWPRIDAALGPAEVRARCIGCGHVGSRVFSRTANGSWRDTLGGASGLTPESCICQCGDTRFKLVPVAALGSLAESDEADV